MGALPSTTALGERALDASLTAPERGFLPALYELGDPVSDRVGDVEVAVWIPLRTTPRRTTRETRSS